MTHWRRRPWSLRGKVLVLLGVLLLAGLGFADLVTYRTLHSSLISRENAQLDGLSRAAARELLNGGFPFGANRANGQNGIQPFIEARSLHGTVAGYIPASDAGHLLAPPRLPRVLPVIPDTFPQDPADNAVYLTVPSSQGGQAPYQVRVSRLVDGPLVVAGEYLVVATPLSDVQATMHSLFWTEFGVSAGALVLALLAGFWLVRLSLRPLEEMADTADEIAAGALDRRVPADGSETEVGRLGSALNGMLARIEHAFSEKEASEARLRRFVADASHELRTPLTSIRGYAELFRRGADRRPEDLAKAMHRIEEEAARMGVLVDDLLLLARLDQGRPLAADPVDLAEVVTEAVEAARVVDPDRPISAELVGEAQVVGDHDRLRQVVDNLLANVRLHTPPGTAARIRLRSAADRVVLEVEDSGPGIDPERLAKVFERFYRADGARTRASGGAGLGLSIVQSIVEALGGSVRAENAPSGGALFRVVLPRAGALAPAPAEDQPSASGPGPGAGPNTQEIQSLPWATSQPRGR